VRLLAELLKNRRGRRRFEAKVVDSLPVSRENAARRVEVRQNPEIRAGLKEVALGAKFRKAGNVDKTFRREGLRIPHAAAESHDNDFIRLPGSIRGGKKARRKNAVGDRKGRQFDKLPL
jgi:hypothetical protein